MSDKKVSAFVVRDFNDAGTSERFTAGSIAEISEGAFGNYSAAGLVRAPTAEEKPPAKGDAPKK